MKQRIFISSVQKEFTDERQALRDFISGDALLGRFFELFLFEDMPAVDRRADDLYLAEVGRCNIYLALLGNQYGWEDRDGFSPTHREFNEATRLAKPRLIFVKGTVDKNRHPKMQSFIASAGEQLVRRRFQSLPELTALVYSSLIQYLEQNGFIRTSPFDASACSNATLEDISEDKIDWFLKKAKTGRNYALDAGTAAPDTLAHLNLLEDHTPNHAAILLFGKSPQRFLITSEIKCMHFHGQKVQKPIPSYQIYKGTVFELVDQAVDFVMSKLSRSVGTRKYGPEAPVEYDIPQEVVAEGIVNAVAHRDYTSNASVQVMVFADRLEVWNPGELRPPLSLDKLRQPHPSIPANPLIAEPLFLAKYIEKAGSGTLDMIEKCREVGLKPPEFRLDMGCFILTIWRKDFAAVRQEARKTRAAGEVAGEVTGEVAGEVTGELIQLFKILTEPKTRTELQETLGLKGQANFRDRYLKPALDNGFIVMTNPQKPTSRLQKYRLTEKGRRLLEQADEKKGRS